MYAEDHGSELAVLRTPLTEADWQALGLAEMRVGAVRLETGPPGWGFTRVVADTITVDTWEAPAPEPPPPVHPNTATKIDHVVMRVPSLDQARDQFRAGLGLEVRRRAAPRGTPMHFYRAGEALLEVVGTDGEAGLWGLVLRVADIEVALAAAEGLFGPAHPAVQGGRIASARKTWQGFSVAFLENSRGHS